MKQKQKQQQRKFIRPRNIILILLTLCCFGGCQYFSSRQDNSEAKYMERLDSLTELTTTAQILEAVKAPEKRLYVVNNYQFPKYTLAKDPYHKTTEGSVYISVSVSTEDTDGKTRDTPNFYEVAYGSLSFDDNTPLLDFNNSEVNIAGTGIKKKRPDYTYYYSTLKPDAKLSFIALLGGGEARLSGFDGKRCIAEGDKKRLAEQDGDNTTNFLLKLACIIAGVLIGLFVFADYLTIKEKEQKRAHRQRSKQRKNDIAMKKLLTIIFMMVCCTLTVQAQVASTSLEDIDKGWTSKPISNVVNGSLGIMLERFDQTWPTWMVGSVRSTMEKGLAKEVLDKETDLTVTVDSKNGYVAVGDGGTDGEYMSACYWNRSNGHKLLAVLLGKPTDPCMEVLCTYDYDPQKKTLTPEPDILKGYRWADRKEYSQLFCHLPKKGKTVLVDEWGTEEPQRHTFNWDGMKPVYAKSEPLDVDENGQDPIIVNYQGAQPNVKDFVSALLSNAEEDESMNGLKEAWQFYKNGMKQMPGDELIVDVQNGYVGYVSTSEDNDRQVIECCYWNYADRRHKLVAISNNLYLNGEPEAGQFTGITFYQYDNATRKMKLIYAQDLGLEMDPPSGHRATSHELPRKGKTIVYNYYTPSGKVTKRMTWNGSKFVKEEP